MKKNIFRNETQTGNYTKISNEILQSKTLTMDEKGLLVHLLSLPTGWTINKTFFWKDINISKKHFEDAWKGLYDYRYILSFRIIDKQTKQTIGWRHNVFEIPYPENQFPEIREIGNTIEIPISRKPTSRKPTSRKPVDWNSGNLKIGNIKPQKKIETYGDFPVEKTGGNSQGPEILDEIKTIGGFSACLNDKENPNEMDLGPEIPDLGNKKIDNPNENPVPGTEVLDQYAGPENLSSDFLEKGILIDGKTYYPLVDEKKQSTMLVTQYLERKEIGKKIIARIQKHIEQRITLYEKNKRIIIELLPLHKENLSVMDNHHLIDYLNKISKTLRPGTIENIKRNTKVIREHLKFINTELPVLELGIKKTIEKYSLYPKDYKLTKKVIK